MKLRDLLFGSMLGAVSVWTAAQNTNSLFREDSFRPLTADKRAMKVGDAVLIQIVETSAASSTTDAAARRKSDAVASVTTPSQTVRGGGAQVSSGFDGNAKVQRQGRLVAQISATVTEVNPAGLLTIAGTQEVVINDEAQKISVQGRVRVQDVSETNVILSNRLTDAKISYAGDGDLIGHTRPSWWTKLLNWFGL